MKKQNPNPLLRNVRVYRGQRRVCGEVGVESQESIWIREQDLMPF